jgi:hypothetical protein
MPKALPKLGRDSASCTGRGQGRMTSAIEVVSLQASSIIPINKGFGMMLGKWLQIAVVLGAVALAGCATATPVMDAGDGTYLISADIRDSPPRAASRSADT